MDFLPPYVDYDRVIFVSAAKKTQRAVERATRDSLSEKSERRVSAVAPEGIVAALDELAQPARGEPIVRGYHVRVRYRASSNRESRAHAEAVSRVLAKRR